MPELCEKFLCFESRVFDGDICISYRPTKYTIWMKPIEGFSTLNRVWRFMGAA